MTKVLQTMFTNMVYHNTQFIIYIRGNKYIKTITIKDISVRHVHRADLVDIHMKKRLQKVQMLCILSRCAVQKARSPLETFPGCVCTNVGLYAGVGGTLDRLITDRGQEFQEYTESRGSSLSGIYTKGQGAV